MNFLEGEAPSKIEMSECPHKNNESHNECPSDTSDTPATLHSINKENLMPYAQHLEKPTVILPKDREESTIPKKDGGKWSYPSPLMFYNALLRKGKETSPQDIPIMVDIHNSLNESTWKLLEKIERKLYPTSQDLRLVEFRGRPDKKTPKAWVFSLMGVHTFDRHDWFVSRDGIVYRYVIDYYSAGDSGFSVDIRPAIDGPKSLIDRIKLLF